MKVIETIFHCFFLTVCASATVTVPAWQNVVESNATKAVVQNYISNAIRAEWAGSDGRVSRLMPANLSCQFAVSGDVDVTNRVGTVLQKTIDALNPSLRSELEKHHLINPTLQWLVRSVRSKPKDYLTLKAHPAVFIESDFKEETLVEKAKSLHGNQVPLPVMVFPIYDSPRDPIRVARPGIDYSDVMPETSFSTPFGIGVVLRAPDRFRRIRLAAKTYPFVFKGVRYVWKSSCYTEIKPWAYDNSLCPEKGFAEIKFDLNRFGRRLDIAVFAQMETGVYGTPTIVSFYHCPYAQRKNKSDGRLDTISYSLESKDTLFDLSPIWIHRDWTDYFSVDEKGNIRSFSRLRPNVYRSDEFVTPDEMILSAYSSGLPKTTRRVVYFMSLETKQLDYRQVGDEMYYRLGGYVRKPGL